MLRKIQVDVQCVNPTGLCHGFSAVKQGRFQAFINSLNRALTQHSCAPDCLAAVRGNSQDVSQTCRMQPCGFSVCARYLYSLHVATF